MKLGYSQLYCHESVGPLTRPGQFLSWGRDVFSKQGWVRHAFHITCYVAAHPTSFEEDLVAVVGLGGDTDTNAAIAGAFLGAIHGADAIPTRWRTPVETYRPDTTDRPEEYAPHDIVQLTDALVGLAKGNAENV